ncbi:MAG TPA: hypothetical protein VK184_22740 [Nostocaceae cyanobacterium]|nr:hypothetical protein [Nostocaceae cyanobacterium]
MNKKLVELTEYIFFLLSVFGTVGTVLTQQMFYVAIPLTLSIGWNLVIRRFSQQDQYSEFYKLNQIMNSFNERIQKIESWKQYLNAIIQEQVGFHIEELRKEHQDLITNIQIEVEELQQFQQKQKTKFSQFQQQIDNVNQCFQKLDSYTQESKIKTEDISQRIAQLTLIPSIQIPEILDDVNQRLQELETSLEKSNTHIQQLDNFIRETNLNIQEKIIEIKQIQENYKTNFSQINQLIDSFKKQFHEVDTFIQESKTILQDIDYSLQESPTTLQEENEPLEQKQNKEVNEIDQAGDQSIEALSLANQIQTTSEKPEISTGTKTSIINKLDVNEKDFEEQPEISTGTKTIITNKLDAKEKESELITVTNLRGHKDKVRSVVFSPSGQVLASGSDDKTITIWNLETRQIRTLKGHKGSAWWAGINSLAFSPDGHVLASGSDDKSIKVWNVETEQEIYTLTGHEDKVHCVVISPDGRILASGSQDKTIKLWLVDTGKNISSLELHKDAVLSLAFSPDGKILASGGGGNDKTIKLCYLAEKKVHTITGNSEWFGGITSLAFSPDGKILASGCTDKTIKLWQVNNRQEICTLIGHNDDVYSVAFSPDGKILASGSKDKTIKLWQIDTAREISTFVSSRDEVYSVAFSPDGRRLAAGNGDHTITLFPYC